MVLLHLCPPGSEGAAYAMFTTVYNAAMLVTPSISTLLLQIWDVSESTLQKKQVSGLMKLTILTTIIQTIPICFLFLLPKNQMELMNLASLPNGQSKVGGTLFLCILFGSILYMVTTTIYNIL